jgi:hypothetical protein
VRAPLAGLAAAVAAADVAPPAVLIAGPVVDLADRLAWFAPAGTAAGCDNAAAPFFAPGSGSPS